MERVFDRHPMAAGIPSMTAEMAVCTRWYMSDRSQPGRSLPAEFVTDVEI